MSYLIDTDLLSMLERRNAPAKLVSWVQEHEAEIFLSVVSIAELQFGVDHAPAAHKASLVKWLAETKRRFLPATEQLSEEVLVRWKELLLDLRQKNRTMTCEDSLIAATAIHRQLTVVTHKTRHFEPAGVQIFDPLSY
jgi:predicted nucleic acid-binding protein